MEERDKRFLLEDLCSRLPYGVKCDIGDNKPYTLNSIEVDYTGGHLVRFKELKNGFIMEVYLSEVKPYLFPMSSMTKEQKREYNSLCDLVPTYHYEYGDIVEDEELYDNWGSIGYLIANHFDYKGLFEKGLAHDATGLNIY